MSRSKGQYPVDRAIRQALRTLLARHPHLTQQTLAAQIGRSPSWLNKYINGAGQASIDDLVRIASVVTSTVSSEDLQRIAEGLIHVERA